MHGVDPVISQPVMDALREAAGATADLELLLLFGSRARGDDSPASDWDFGYMATVELDVATLLATLVEVVGSDRVDLVDLRRASGLLLYRAAREGQPLHEAHPGIADRFCLEAVRFWCDAAPVLDRAHDDVLAELRP